MTKTETMRDVPGPFKSMQRTLDYLHGYDIEASTGEVIAQKVPHHYVRLLAASPDMLEALKIVRLMLREAGETREGVTFAVAEGMFRKIEDAVKKAEA